jgi:very-short-patch-repair endonuclease
MTVAEVRLWRRLSRDQIDGHRFRRQVPIGPYILDFLCVKSRLVIEVDGGQHSVAVEKDDERTAWLKARGFRVLRFWNNQVLEETDGVVERIREALGPPPRPPQGGRRF